MLRTRSHSAWCKIEFLAYAWLLLFELFFYMVNYYVFDSLRCVTFLFVKNLSFAFMTLIFGVFWKSVPYLMGTRASSGETTLHPVRHWLSYPINRWISIYIKHTKDFQNFTITSTHRSVQEVANATSRSRRRTRVAIGSLSDHPPVHPQPPHPPSRV